MGKDYHPLIMQLIEGSKNEYTYKIDSFPKDIEEFLEIKKCKDKYRKPQHIMLKLREGSISKERMEELKNLVRKLIKN